METLDDIQYRNLKKLVQALEILDDCIIGACEDPQLTISINDVDLNTLKDSRMEPQSEYTLSQMLHYLTSTPNGKRVWSAAMISLRKAYNITGQTKSLEWKFWVHLVQTRGDEAWRLAVPASQAIGQAAPIGGADIINGIADKFNRLDDFMDLVYPDIIENGQRTRFSEEFQDTLTALIEIGKLPDPYQPPLTMENINVVKSQIRRRRKAQASVTPIPESTTTKQQSNIALPQSGAPRDFRVSLTAFVWITAVLSVVPGYLGWQYSPHIPGTSKDADFWFLIQSSMMQVLGLMTIIFSLLLESRLPTQTWFWTWGFVVASFLCSLIAPIIYVYLPTEWATATAFLGSMAQCFVILQTLFLTSPSSVSAKKGANTSPGSHH